MSTRFVRVKFAKSISLVLLTTLTATGSVFAQTPGLEEVLVTAQKRVESLQDAAIPIDAIEQTELTRAGIESGLDLGALSPSLGISAGGGPLASIFVRGVGAVTAGPLFDAAVAQNYDGVYLGRSSAAAGVNFFDMERVELLKGPQGTLYGRNATGGVINYIPAKPNMDGRNGYLEAEVGNYSKLGLQGALNLPLSDTAALRVAANINNRDGFADDGTNDAESTSLRAQLLFKPSDRLSIRLAGDYTDVGGAGQVGALVGTYGAGPATNTFFPSNLDPDSGGTSDAANAVRTAILGAPNFAFLNPIDTDDIFQDFTYLGVMAELNYTTDSGTFTFIPAFRDTEEDYTFVGPGFAAAPTSGSSEQLSIEARFTTDYDGRFNGVVGLFYFDEEGDTSANFAQESVSPIQNYDFSGDSWALFAQGTLDVSDRFRINAGLRYTEDEKQVVGGTNTFVTFCGGPPGPDFITPPASFGQCDVPGALPIGPSVSDPQVWIDTLIAQGFLLPGSTPADGFYPIIAPGPGGAIIDIDAGLSLTNDIAYDETTWRIGIEYDYGDDSLLYATFETGYRAGGVDISLINPTYKPEFIDAITIGSKNRLRDNSIQLNLEAFLWKYEDQQVSTFATINGGPAFPTANADSTIQGLDVDFLWAATDTMRIGAKVQFLDATFDRLNLQSDPGTGRYGCAATGIGANGLEQFDCSGISMLYTPDIAADITVSNTVVLSSSYAIDWVAALSYRDDQFTDFSLLEATVAESYTTLNLEATLIPPSGNWSLTLFGRNVTDERYPVTTNINGSQGIVHQVFNSPSTYGLRLRVDF